MQIIRNIYAYFLIQPIYNIYMNIISGDILEVFNCLITYLITIGQAIKSHVGLCRSLLQERKI